MLMVYMEAPRGVVGVRPMSLARLFENGVKVGAGEDEQSRIGQGV